MHPVLLDSLWGTPIHSYGTLILFGLWVAVPGMLWEAKDRKLPKLFVVDFYLALIIASIVGGRLLFVLLHLDQFVARPLQILYMYDGGFVFHGSAAAATLACLWLSHRYRTPLSTIWDSLLTWGPLAHAFGRTGCLLAGCCYGIYTDAAWGIAIQKNSFAAQNESISAHANLGLHPVQLYEAIGLLLLFAFQLHTRHRIGSRKPWMLSSNWAICYGGLRLFTEFFRADDANEHLFDGHSSTIAHWLHIPPEHPLILSMAQAISLGLIILGVALRYSAKASDHL